LFGALGGLGDAPAAPPPTASALTFGDPFWAFWGDGKGELAGYDLTFPRYGQLRHGVAVTIFVTETFSSSLRVKSDPGKHPKSDEFPVMKLNLVRDFPTGIYDYNLMTSAFWRSAGAQRRGRDEGRVRRRMVRARLYTCYSTTGPLASFRTVISTRPTNSRDRSPERCAPRRLPWARGSRAVAHRRTENGARGSPLTARHASAVGARLATLARSTDKELRVVMAGRFETERFTAEVTGGPTWTFWIETAAPHRLVEWMSSDGEHALLLGSDRLKYWELHDLGGEKYLARLGLTPRPLRTP
jgi:hypothetical protein